MLVIVAGIPVGPRNYDRVPVGVASVILMTPNERGTEDANVIGLHNLSPRKSVRVCSPVGGQLSDVKENSRWSVQSDVPSCLR